MSPLCNFLHTFSINYARFSQKKNTFGLCAAKVAGINIRLTLKKERNPIMAIIYDKVEKKSPISKEPKWYVSVKTIKQVDDKEVARLIADETTLNPQEALMAIAQLEKVMLNLLKGGYSVKLGDWASFSASVSSHGVDKPEDVNASLVKEVKANCRFSPSFKESLNRAEFVPATKFKP